MCICVESRVRRLEGCALELLSYMFCHVPCVSVASKRRRVRQNNYGTSMYARDATGRLRADERTLNAVNMHAWQTLMPLVPAATRVMTPQFVSVPRTRADEWTLRTTTARNAELRSLLASGVTFREVNERFGAGRGNIVAAPEAEAAPEARRDD